MIYDEATGALFASDGRLLKVVGCPKAVKWTSLERLAHPPVPLAVYVERARHCKSCKSNVVSLEGMTDEDAVKLFDEQPDACVYFQAQWKNITILRSRGVQPSIEATAAWRSLRQGRAMPEDEAVDHDVAQVPVIRTARGLDEINSAAAQGYRPVIKAVPDPSGSACRSYLRVVQNRATGEVDYDQYGSYEEPQFQLVFSAAHYVYGSTEPVAAYLIPPDLPVGAEVIVDDPIEDVPGWSHHGTYRAYHVPATWTGTELILKPAPMTLKVVVG